jgi:putative flippase GtrA
MTYDRRIDYVAAIIVNLALLYAAHELPTWHIPYVTEKYAECLWAIDLSFAANIIANCIYLFHDKEKTKGIGRIILNLIGLNFIYTFYTIYPFDFSTMPDLEQAAKIAFITGIIGIAFSTIIEALKLLPDKKPTSP